jgi:FdrA protein
VKTAVRLRPDTYLDSVRQLAGTRAMRQLDGVDWAAVAMATEANLKTLSEHGFDPPDAGPADLFLAVRATDDATADAAFDAGEQEMFGSHESGVTPPTRPRSLDEALHAQSRTTVAVISVPGDYAALEAHKALARGLDVLLFSDNVSIADEVALKDHARQTGRLLMGPGAGTAMLGGVGLGFANAVRRGPVGIVAAAGTGAQEAMALLHRWGSGVSYVIGVGGRDLTDAVGGRMTALAIETLRDDPDTDVILLVSKPAAPAVVDRVVGRAGGKPLAAAVVGSGSDAPHWADTLEGGVVEALELLGMQPPDRGRIRGPAIADVSARLDPHRTTIRGLYSGGTLCYEALVVLGRAIGPVWSNTPLDDRYRVPAPPGASTCIDLGEEEYTRGRPHPMIDPEVRIDMLRDIGDDVAVVLLDVVLGHGAHPDPAGVLAPVCAEISGPRGPQVVAYVLGTDRDPQNYDDQVRTLVDAGCVVTETGARAALTAAAIVRHT